MGRSVLIALNSFRVGGSQTYTATLAQLLHQRGWNVAVIGKAGPMIAAFDGYADCVTTLWTEGVPGEHRSPIKRRVLALAESRLAPRLQKLPTPDAIIASQPMPTARMVDVRDRIWPDVPVFGLVHGTLPVEFPPDSPTTTIPAIEKWFTSTREAQFRLEVTEGLDSTLLGNIFRGELYWGERPHRSAENRRERVLFAGTLTPGKTQPLYALMEALSSVSVDVTIAGDGPERAELESLAARLGIRSRVSFVGNVIDVRNLIREADIFIGAGRAAIEAGSSGIPVIVANSDGLHGLVSPQNFSDAEAANFTGRSLSSVRNSPQELTKSLGAAVAMSASDTIEVADRFWQIGSIEPLLDSLSGDGPSES